MPKLDEQTQQVLEEFTRRLAELCGEELISVVLYGSAAGAHYLPGLSDLNVLIVLREISPGRLREIETLLHPFLRRYPIEPVFLSARDLSRLAEAYPIEAADLKDERRVLHGEDVMAKLSVSPQRLRAQLLSELPGKTMRLRSLYLDAYRNARSLEGALSDAVGSFGALLRAILRLAEPHLPPPQEFLEVVTQIEERFRFDLPGLREAYQVKLGTHRLTREELRALFEQLLEDAETLAQHAPEILEVKE
jgi:predicted nucleotidyltransferase